MSKKKKERRKSLPLNVQRAKETANLRTLHLKKKFLTKLENALGVVTTACRQMDIARSTFYDWMKDDKDFKEQVEDISEVALDVAESQLHKLMLADNPAAIIFYLKTKGKKRGYIERHDIKVNKVGMDAMEETYE